jgi:hypothetical protein
MDRWESWWRACSGAIDDEKYRFWFAVEWGYKAQCTESRRSSRRCFFSFLFCSRMLRKGIRSWWANSVELRAFMGRVTAFGS